MIRKLLIIRKKHVRTDTLDKAGIKQFTKGEPLSVTPMDWKDEDGVTHYGWVFDSLRLKDLDLVRDFANSLDAATLLELPQKTEKGEVEAALNKVGLRVNTSA